MIRTALLWSKRGHHLLKCPWWVQLLRPSVRAGEKTEPTPGREASGGRRSEVTHSHPRELPEQCKGKQEAPGQEETRETPSVPEHFASREVSQCAPPSKEKGEAQEVSTSPRKGRTEAHSRSLSWGPSLLPKALRCLERTQGRSAISAPAGQQAASPSQCSASYTVVGKGNAKVIILSEEKEQRFMQPLWVHTQCLAPHAHSPWTPSPTETICTLGPSLAAGRLRRALWWSTLEPHAPRAQDQTSQPSVRGNKGRWNPFVNTQTTRETDKPRVQPSFRLLHTNSGRKTTSLPPFFFSTVQLPGYIYFQGFKSSFDLFSIRSPRKGALRPNQPVQGSSGGDKSCS